MFKYFMQWESSYNGKGEPTDAQIAEAIASVQRQDNRLTVPEYTVDKNSEAEPPSGPRTPGCRFLAVFQ